MPRQHTYALILALAVFPFASARASKETEPPPVAPPQAPAAPPAAPAPPAAEPAPPAAAPAPPSPAPSPPAAAPAPPSATPAAPPAAAPAQPPAAAPPQPSPDAPSAPVAPATPATPAPLAAPEPKKGRVRVTADQAAPGATVVVDGIGMGPLPWEGDLPAGPHTIDLLGGSVTAKPKTVDVTGTALLEVRLETVFFPPPVEAKPVLAPPPAPVATVATPGPQAPAPQGYPHIGVMLGVLSLPRPLQIEATFRPFGALSFSGQYSMLPDLTAPGGSASLQLRAYQGIVRWFPFSGAFFIGSGLGFQTFRASLATEVQGGTLVTTADLSAPFVSPQIGWLFVWQSGFTLGVTLGVQFTLPQEPKFPATYNGQPVPDMPGPGVPQEVVDRVEESRDEIRTLAKLATKYPLPNLDLLRIGFFF